MNLSHYSNEPALVLRSVKQEWRYGKPASYEKPNGLWVSVDGEDDWAAWCAAESFPIGAIRHRVELVADARILRCQNAFDLDCLTERYKIEVPSSSWHRVTIDWSRVAGEYQGIIIAPYVWSRKLHEAYDWYYGWDCASGCIWDAAAVSLIEPVKEVA